MEAQGPQSSPCPCPRSRRKQDAHLCCFARAKLQAPHLSGHPPLLVSTPSLPAPGWRPLPVFPSSRPLPAPTARGVATQGPPRCWPFPQLSGKEVQQGTQVAPAHAPVLEGHQLAHPQPGGHPQPRPPLGSLGKGLGHRSPPGGESPTLSAWPLQDMTSPCARQLGPRPTHCAGNLLSHCSDPSDGGAHWARRSGSHSLGLCWCHPRWPAGVMPGPLGSWCQPAWTPGCWPPAAAARERSAASAECRRSAGNGRTQRKRLVDQQPTLPRGSLTRHPPHPQRAPEGRGRGRSLTA